MSQYNFKGIMRSINEGSNIDTSKFKTLLSSKNRLKIIRQKILSMSNIGVFVLKLIQINPKKFGITFLLFMIQLGLTTTSPFIINYIIQNYLSESSQSISFGILILIVLAYKLVKSITFLLCDFCYTSVGYEYFARLYWYILNNYYMMTGNILNLIQYDCGLLSNLCYALLTSLFNFLEIFVLLGLLIKYLMHTANFSLFMGILIIYLASNVGVNYFTFSFSRNYLNQKDKRLSQNIINNSFELIIKYRQQQLVINRRFLYLKIVSKFIGLIFPALINIYVFVLTDRESIKNDEYILLILINLIRSPIDQLLFTANMMVEIIYSCRRIITFASTLTSSLIIKRQDSIQQSQFIEKPFQSSLIPSTISIKQTGNISLPLITKYCREHISLPYISFLLFVILMVLVGKYLNFFITKHIIANTYSTIDFLGMAYQIVIPLVLYFILIHFSQKIAYSIFHEIKSKPQNINCEFLNRISGDITAIDRATTTNSYQVIISVNFILASYTYSIVSLNQLWIQILLALFFFICIVVAFKVNRFIMTSRRQVIRQECFLKSGIIRCLLKQKKIKANKQMRRLWRNIFECKQMGLFIQNYYMCILSTILLIFSLILIVLSEYLDIPNFEKSIIFISCMNIDFDMLNMFFAAVRLELSLVSFQRVLNAIKYE